MRQIIGSPRATAIVLALGIGLGAFVFERSSDSQEAPPTLSLVEFDTAFRKAAKHVRSAAVEIAATQDLSMSGRTVTRRIAMSGTVWDAEKGLIVTIGRGLQAATAIAVIPTTPLSGAIEPIEAKLIGLDEKTGVALLQAKVIGRVRSLPRPSKDAPAPEAGNLIITVGHPFGLRGSVHIANIAGTQRTINIGRTSHPNTLEITTPVNPGDPGGLVANAKGQLIAIMASSLRQGGASFDQKVTEDFLKRLNKMLGSKDTPENALLEQWQRRMALSGAQGIGFAIPVKTIEEAIARIKTAAKAPRVWLGVQVVTLPEGLRKKLTLADGEGILVTGVVMGSPAGKSGLLTEDVILRWNDAKIGDIYELRGKVLSCKPGDKASLKVLREGKQLELTLTLEARKG